MTTQTGMDNKLPDWYQEWKNAAKENEIKETALGRGDAAKASTKGIASFFIGFDKLPAVAAFLDFLPNMYNDTRSLFLGRRTKTSAISLISSLTIGVLGAALALGITIGTLGAGAPVGLGVMAASFALALPLGRAVGLGIAKRQWPEEQLELTPRQLDKLAKMGIDTELADEINNYLSRLILSTNNEVEREAYKEIRIQALEEGNRVAINYIAQLFISELSNLNNMEKTPLPTGLSEEEKNKINRELNKRKTAVQDCLNGLKEAKIKDKLTKKENNLLNIDEIRIKIGKTPEQIASEKKAAMEKAKEDKKKAKNEEKERMIKHQLKKLEAKEKAKEIYKKRKEKSLTMTPSLQQVAPSQSMQAQLLSPQQPQTQQDLPMAPSLPKQKTHPVRKIYLNLHQPRKVRPHKPQIHRPTLSTPKIEILTVPNEKITKLQEQIEMNKSNYGIKNCKPAKKGGLEIEFESSPEENVLQKVHAAPSGNDGMTFFVESASSSEISDALIEKICKMAVDMAQPYTEFDLSDCPEEKRMATKVALEKAISEAKLPDGTNKFSEATKPTIRTPSSVKAQM